MKRERDYAATRRLSTMERKELVTSTIVDQPRNLKVVNFELLMASVMKNPKTLDYNLSLVNGYVMIPLNKSSNSYTFEMFFDKVISLAKK